MSNILEYTLSLQDQMSAKLQKIGINTETAANTFSKLRQQSLTLDHEMSGAGRSVSTLSQKLQ